MADPETGAASSSAEVEIKFVIVPEGFSHTRKFATSLTLLEMKQQVEAHHNFFWHPVTARHLRVPKPSWRSKKGL